MLRDVKTNFDLEFETNFGKADCLRYPFSLVSIHLMEKIQPLPYTDAKPVGAADFYFAINATFRFILQKFGVEGLRRYWMDLGEKYFAPVSAAWKLRGLEAVAEYWKAFFDAEPKSEVEIISEKESVTRDAQCQSLSCHQTSTRSWP
jgi:hypothetical protein